MALLSPSVPDCRPGGARYQTFHFNQTLHFNHPQHRQLSFQSSAAIRFTSHRLDQGPPCSLPLHALPKSLPASQKGEEYGEYTGRQSTHVQARSKVTELPAPLKGLLQVLSQQLQTFSFISSTSSTFCDF